MTDGDKAVTKKRMSMLFVIIFLILAMLIFRLSFVQLAQGQEYQTLANDNQYVSQPILAPRGLILDRNQSVLVRNKPSFTITFQRLSDSVQNPVSLAAQLSTIFNMRPEDLYTKMDPQGLKYSFATARDVVTNATPQEVAYVDEHADELPGFNVVAEPVRDYVYGDLASHVIGYLNAIPPDFYNAHQKDYLPTDKIGMAGVESQYESYLHGKNGALRVEVNNNYQPIKQQTVQNPVPGDNLVLTIDQHLQQVTQNVLAQQVQTIHKSVPTVVNGAVIAMNPKTGEILAMASYPYYDPNMWVNGISDQQYQNVFKPAEMNRAIQQVYLPGSTLKMSTVLIGLKEGAITPYSTYYDPGYIDFGNTVIRSWTTGLGTVDPYSALAKSSNVYMIHVFENLFHYNDNMTSTQVNYFLNNTLPDTMKKVINYQKEFGLGPQTTGVDLPYEATGSITQEGVAADLAFTAFGQTENYTLMQLAQYVSTIANNGKRMQPYVVSQIESPSGRLVKKTVPKMVNQVDFTQDELKVVQQGMYDVIHQPYGTFSSVFTNYPIQVAGKSGTAETGRGTENDLFVGYAPYNDPQIAIAIIMPDNKVNSMDTVSLGPIAKAMMDAYFKLDQKKTTASNGS